MSISLQQYLSYLQYLAVGLGMTALFSAVYLRITPADELKLIKNGNLACALSFGGALIGFCLPLASSITHSVGLLDFVLWSWAAAACRPWCCLWCSGWLPRRDFRGGGAAQRRLFGVATRTQQAT